MQVVEGWWYNGGLIRSGPMSAVIAGDQKMPDRDHNIASHSSSGETLNLSPDSILVYGRLRARNLLPVTRAGEYSQAGTKSSIKLWK